MHENATTLACPHCRRRLYGLAPSQNVRVLATQAEAAVPVEPRSYVSVDGRLDVARLLDGFAQLRREHGEVVAGRIDYPEVAPQLVLMAWLHRIVNGGGSVEREVGSGSTTACS